MNLTTTLQALLASDPGCMRVLAQVRDLALPDCWVGAGFVRNRVWDHLHGRMPPALDGDIDVIWFDVGSDARERDLVLERRLRSQDGSRAWSVKNQARMHHRNGDSPYLSATDAMRYWPETATAVGVRLDELGAVEVAAPFGLDDLFDLLVRPTPRFTGEKYPVYLERQRAKQWQATWPGLTIYRTAGSAADTPPG
jgi:hypothetical protein